MRLIDADALCCECIEETIFLATCEGCVVKEYKLNKTIDPESLRPQGEWSVGYYNYEGVYVRDCSYCGYAHDDLSPYCPSCGARMKGGADSV